MPPFEDTTMSAIEFFFLVMFAVAVASQFTHTKR